MAKAIVLLTILFPALASSAWAQTASGAAAMTATEQRAAAELFQLTNEDRARHDLQPLKQDPMLAEAAWKHAQQMVQSGALTHQLPGEPDLIVRVQQAGVHGSMVAENIAGGTSASEINDEWMHSPTHRANLLDPRLNAVGIAIIKNRGQLFAVQDFARELTSLSRSQQEQQVAALLTSHGLHIQTNPAPARSYCEGAPPRQPPMPKLVMRYSTSDLQHLPAQVEHGISGGSFHSADVGACPASKQNGFSAYQIVILLY